MSVRVDKFIWCVRLCKTRSKATELIKKGKVKINNEQEKPSKLIEEGDVIQLNKGTAQFEYKVKSPLKSRVGAKLVSDYLADLTPQKEIEKYKMYQEAKASYRTNESGKPTKKDLREIKQFLNEG